MHEAISMASEFDLVHYIANHEADQSELDIFADFHQRSPAENMSSMDSTQMLIDSSNSQDEHNHQRQGYSHSQHHHSVHAQQHQQQHHQHQQHQQQSQQQQQQQQPQQHTRVQIPQSHMMSPEMLDLKERLEQQMKLQQLQQLLLQQQIDLLSGATPSPTQHLGPSHQKDDMFGLLTPGPSTELPAMAPKDMVPPMMLQPDMFLGSPANAFSSQQQQHHHHEIPIINPNPSFSAPAALAFPTASPYPLPLDFSPISSPWIPPHHNAQPQHDLNSSQSLLPLHPPHPSNSNSNNNNNNSTTQQTSSHALHPNIPRPHLKRVGSVDDHMVNHHPPRKRSLKATPPSSSATSTPMTVPNSASTYYYPPNDTPSPVDLSMTAPALSSTPSTNSPPNLTHDIGSDSHQQQQQQQSQTPIAPMTPASILNLRRFSTGLVQPSHLHPPPVATTSNTKLPSPASSLPQPQTGAAISMDSSKESPNKKTAGNSSGKAKASIPTSTVTGRGRKGSAATLKPLLPGTAQPPTPTSPLPMHVNLTGTSAAGNGGGSGGAGTGGGGAGGGPRKSSHKVAEQKRRDSLKTSFDELRLLLPPVALPEDEELLPGCMPPRGPPKGDADGPNRGVSKLALLRCGNGYIRELKGMVQRRDDEIGVLRNEIRRLRVIVGEDEERGGGESGDVKDGVVVVDLDRDVDEGRQIESNIRLGVKAGTLSSVQEEADDED